MLKTCTKVLLVCLLIWGCSGKNEDVALIVNGKKYSKQQIAKATVMFRQNIMRTLPEQTMNTMTLEIRPIVARELITNQLMFEEAKKRKIRIDSGVVNKSFEKLKSGYPAQSDFENELQAMGETENHIKSELEKVAMLDTLLKIISADVDTVAEKECHDFYEQNSSHFTESPRFRVSQIFFPADSSKDRAGWEKSRKEAQAVLGKIKAGMKFETAAGFSKGGSGGDMGWFKKGDLKPELQSAIEPRKTGETSDIVSTGTGFHIFKKTGEEEAKVLPFEEVKENIGKTLSLRKKTEYISLFADSLVKISKITYVDTSLIPRKDAK